MTRQICAGSDSVRPVMEAFRDMEDVSYWLLSLLGANRTETQQRKLLGRHEQMVERLLETQDGADQQLRETLAVEEEAARSLLELKECTRLGGTELQQLEVEIQKASQEDACLQARLSQLTTELQELREMEADLQRQERDVDEDTTITIPSAVYVAQLYHRISNIEWDYECEPGMIKGIHHGPTVAHPIHLDSAQLSQKFISDYLWSLVDTTW
ncbi:kinetochore protein Spc24 isoform X1 [Acomys russatus]|uniref:kinetochore protein Spc24 isoform X1 n=1 Tax=Acomys russatus TaxID=60746 RepID=UPI0021E25909|nr:kinetochore protein Spc24 isoform X1 [Acomys russatus]